MPLLDLPEQHTHRAYVIAVSDAPAEDADVGWTPTVQTVLTNMEETAE